MAFAAMTSHSSAVAFTACSQPQLPQAVLRTSMSRPASTRVQLQQRSRVLQQRRSTRIPTQAFSSVEAAPASSPVRVRIYSMLPSLATQSVDIIVVSLETALALHIVRNRGLRS